METLDIRTSPFLKLLGVNGPENLATNSFCPGVAAIGVPHLPPAGIVGIPVVVVRQQPFGPGPGTTLEASKQVPYYLLIEHVPASLFGLLDDKAFLIFLYPYHDLLLPDDAVLMVAEAYRPDETPCQSGLVL
ncbi:hypothetical protein [Methanoculleus bourgensis]|uniref:hypothetical protein n=1 Tax=Methanoculleus bourgensis TaxID=83986 RepID=UPI002490A819|nr:hypothetical protein [Methanoculleus bourgensis]